MYNVLCILTITSIHTSSVSLYIYIYHTERTVYGVVLAIIRSDIGCMVFAEKAAPILL